jgi:protein-S-isoprenylcysteine O-methyltransferase Ste14
MDIRARLVIIAFFILGLVFSIQYFGLLLAKIKITGRSTIIPIHFVFAKLSLAITWFLFCSKAIFPDLGYATSTATVEWAGVILLYAGVIFMAMGIHEMGISLRIGLPENRATLKTKGIFKLTRNPLYIGTYFISAGSCLYFPDLVNIAFTIYGIVAHHFIILNEEKFLLQQYGESYENYIKKVNRYF